MGRWSVLLPMLVSTIAAISLFSVFTYITPYLEQVTGLSPRSVTAALLTIGLGLTAGNLIGGRLADRSLIRTIIGSFTGLVAVLAVLALVGADEPAVLIVLAVWGALAFALVSPLQTWVVEAATGAPNLASTLNQGAFNLGNALGAGLGGAALTAGMGYAWLPLIGAGVAALGLLLVLASRAWPAQLAEAQVSPCLACPTRD